MPGIPLFARREKLADYARECLPVAWREERIQASDGTELALCIGTIPNASAEEDDRDMTGHDVVIVYFQGNASSMPPRLPLLSNVLRALGKSSDRNRIDKKTRYTIVALSYRGYWTSRGQPSQQGIERDAVAALDWVRRKYETAVRLKRPTVILWGQSLGAAVATTAAAQYLRCIKLPESLSSNSCRIPPSQLNLGGLVLETPFTSIRDMLVGIYPQHWLPYRYLGPFLRNNWDTRVALHGISQARSNINKDQSHDQVLPKILMLQAGRDELVPSSHAMELESLCRQLGFEITRTIVAGALHTEVMLRAEGQQAVAEFLQEFS